MLEADNRDIFDMVLRLTAYHYPENIVLPQGRFHSKAPSYSSCNLERVFCRIFPAQLGY